MIRHSTPFHRLPDSAPGAPSDPAPGPVQYARRTRWILVILTALLLGLWVIETPPGLLGKADAVGYAICHRMAARSFHVHARPLPLCARCTGIYLGVIVTLIVLARQGRLRAGQLPRARFLAVLVLLGALYGADGLNSYLTLFPGYRPLYTPHNTLRLISGLSFGITLITLALPFFNTLAWRAPLAAAPVQRWRDLGAIYAAAALTAGLVLAQQPAILLAAGLISAAGVLLMFVLVGSLAFLMAVRRENQAQTWRDLLIPALAGLVFALILLGGIDLARYALTGTWGGFDLSG